MSSFVLRHCVSCLPSIAALSLMATPLAGVSGVLAQVQQPFKTQRLNYVLSNEYPSSDAKLELLFPVIQSTPGRNVVYRLEADAALDLSVFRRKSQLCYFSAAGIRASSSKMVDTRCVQSIPAEIGFADKQSIDDVQIRPTQDLEKDRVLGVSFDLITPPDAGEYVIQLFAESQPSVQERLGEWRVRIEQDGQSSSD
ncbi:MAG: hypothetical protein VKM98_06185 [Cyanobacteriota bacterium]|nr:hypothetical protein [Cyanobacteriota bacterium]